MHNDTIEALNRTAEIETWECLSHSEQTQIVRSINRISAYLEDRATQGSIRMRHANLLSNIFCGIDTFVTVDPVCVVGWDEDETTQERYYVQVNAVLKNADEAIDPLEFSVSFPEKRTEPSYHWLIEKGGHYFTLHLSHDLEDNDCYATITLMEQVDDYIHGRSYADAFKKTVTYRLDGELEDRFQHALDDEKLTVNSARLLPEHEPLKISRKMLNKVVSFAYDPLESLYVAIEGADLDTASELLTKHGYSYFEEKIKEYSGDASSGALQWSQQIIISRLRQPRQTLALLDLFLEHGCDWRAPEVLPQLVRAMINDAEFSTTAALLEGLVERGVPLTVDAAVKEKLQDSRFTKKQRAQIETILLSQSESDARRQDDPSIGL